MRTIISSDQLRILLNDTRDAMRGQPWLQAIDDHSEIVALPHGKMEALDRLDHNEWIFVPVVRTKNWAGRTIEHGFEVHRRENGWEVVTAALETDGDQTANVHEEIARDYAVQKELEKLRRESQPTA